MLRILHIFGCMDRGGAEMRTLDLMRRLPSEGFVFEFCALSGQPGTLDDEIRRLGGEVHYCKLKDISFPTGFLQLLRVGRYDVVHSHVHYFSGCILLFARLAGVRGRIAHFRSTTDGKFPTLSRNIQTALMKYLVKSHASLILGVGHAVMEQCWGRNWQSDSRCAVISNGIDTAYYDLSSDPECVLCEFGIPANSRMIVHVGRMDKPKNHNRLAAILCDLLAGRSEIYALLVGKKDAEIMKTMNTLFSEHGVINRVRYAGVRSDVPRILLSADFLLFPSLWEGLPGAVLEACAVGTPVLASDIPGIKELVGIFADLHTVSLDAPNSDWVRIAEFLLMSAISIEQRTEALSHFRKTPYNIDRCIESYVLAWSGNDNQSKMKAASNSLC